MRSERHAAGRTGHRPAPRGAPVSSWSSLAVLTIALALLATFWLGPPAHARGQADTYVDPAYAGAYVGPSPGGGTSAGGAGRLSPSMSQGAAGSAISLANNALGDPAPAIDAGDPRLFTGRDLLTFAALGSAVVAFAVSASRFRTH